MNKIFRFSAYLAAAMLAVGAVISCSDEELDTAQYSSGKVTLASYGPNPVMRGATLRFFGSNLQKIVEVNVPGVNPITDIEVVAEGEQSEIRVQLPADGPEVGCVTLVASDGKKFTTQTELTYTEPIVFESFSVKSPAMPGDVLSLKGDYMNLVKSVTFEGGETVYEIDNVDRYNAKVTIPSTAITGKIFISDEGEVANIIYSEKDLVIGDPTVSSVKTSAWKPASTVTVSGAYLNMVKEVRFAGDVVVPVEDLTVSADWKTLTLSLPAEVQSGDVIAVSYAGKEFKAGMAAMVIPSSLSAAPAPVKAGAELTISGKDLDVVSSVDFPNAKGTAFTLADGKISLTVPAAAQEGDIVLNMVNGDTAEVPFTLVHPAVTSVSPVELKAGETIEIAGTDLDLITGVTLGGKTVEFTAEETKVVVTTANTSVSGKLVLSLANGETVNPEDAITLSYDSFIIVNEMPSAEHIGATVTMKGENFMMIENIFIGEAKVTTYITRSDNEISFIMPYNSTGVYNMYFDLLSGDRETCPQQIEVLLELSYIIGWEGNTEITWGDGGRIMVPAVKFNDVRAGSKMRLYYTQKDQVWAQAQINYGDWSALVFPEIGAGTLVPTDMYGWFSDGILDRCTEVTLTKEILENIEAKKGECEGTSNIGIIIQGSDLIFTKIEIVQEIPQETTIWEGSEYTGPDYENNLQLGGEDDWVNAGLYEGAEIRLYFTADSATDWQIQLFDGHWNGMSMLFPGSANPNQFNATNSPDAIANGYISFKADSEVFTALTTKAWWGYAIICQGKGITFTRIAFK